MARRPTSSATSRPARGSARAAANATPGGPAAPTPARSVRPDVIVDFSVDREGADQRVRKLPGFRKYNNLVLKRGFTSDRSLWEWRQTVAYGRVERRNGSVSCSMPAERSYA